MCPMCRAGLKASCMSGGCEPSPVPPVGTEDQEKELETEDEERGSFKGRGSDNSHRKYKRDAVLKDQQSTGRKRAARLFPLDREAPCEWRGKADVGGGLYPIIGCLNGLQEARHHGPDKSVSNNDVGNVHRICHKCHNTWHSANNDSYDWNNTNPPPHRPRPQTPEEKEKAILSELKFKANKQKRIRD